MRFNSRFTETIKMFTRTGGDYIDGGFVPGSEVETDIIASVQRLSMRERQLLPEGNRASESLKVYTEIDVVQLIENANSGQGIQQAAEFEYKNKRYAMLSSEKWEYLIPHFKVTLIAKTEA